MSVTDTPVLELSGVSKSFGAVQALYEVDFRVAPGQVMALVGDNGAGKSTLIKCIAGIHPIDSGEIRFEGQPVNIHGPKDAADLGIEVVYQDLALCDNLDVVQNMYLGRELVDGVRKLDETAMEAKAQETLRGALGHDAAQRAPDRRRPLRRPAAVRRRGQGRDVELQARHPRRADRGARRRADPRRCSSSSSGSASRASR